MFRAEVQSGTRVQQWLGALIALVTRIVKGLLLCAIPGLPALLAIVGIFQDEDCPTPGTHPAARGLVACMRMDSAVWSLAFTPDGRHLAASDENGDMVVLALDDPESRPLPRLGPRRQPVTLRSTRDGRLLALLEADPRIRAWGEASWETTVVPELLGGLSVAFSPDGRYLAAPCGDGRSVRIWTWPDRQEVTTLRRHADRMVRVTFAPDSRTLATGDAGGWVTLHDLATGRDRATWRAHAFGDSALSYSPDGALLVSTSMDGPVAHLWDGSTGRPRGVIAIAASGITDAMFTPDGASVALAGTDGVVRLVDPSTGHERAALRALGLSCYRLAISPDGRYLAAAAADRSVRVWDLPTVLGSSLRSAAP
jgi:WD40 repeat protein